jgi:hypothetical protein
VKAAGRLSDEFVTENQAAIEWKMNDIETQIRRINPSLPDSDYNAKMCVVYGTLAWLQYNDIVEHQTLSRVKSIKEGDITITYASEQETRTEAPDTSFDYHQLYKKYLRKIIGVKAFTSGTTWTLSDGTTKRVGFDWTEFFEDDEE